MSVQVGEKAPGACGRREPGVARPGLAAPPGGGLSSRRGAAAEGRGAEPMGALVTIANGGVRDMAGAAGWGRARSEAGAALAAVPAPCPASPGPGPCRHGALAGCYHRQVKFPLPERRCRPGSAPRGSGSLGTCEWSRAPSRRGPACGQAGLPPRPSPPLQASGAAARC